MGKANDLHSTMASALRGGRGWVSKPRSRADEPEKLLELYEFESCPFCRKVRETLSELDLAYISRTGARGSANRAQLVKRAGREMMPFLIDANTSTEMYESEDIIDYLHATYGTPRNIAFRVLSPLNSAAAMLASAVRPFGGRAQRPRVEQPAELLELYNFEASPYCRKVREVLNELDLDYVVLSVAKRSARRAELVERGGKMMVPYLVDKNTGTEMYESDAIIAYLRATYSA